MKKRTPSSSAMSTHSSIRRSYARDDDSMSAFIPMGRSVRDRMKRRPSRKSWPCTNVSDTG
jgi:hypothetical protein